jgi:hypothetical protein
MLKDLVNRVKVEVENEKKERYWIPLIRAHRLNRENTEETLLTLLEDTTNKLNAASHI